MVKIDPIGIKFVWLSKLDKSVLEPDLNNPKETSEIKSCSVVSNLSENGIQGDISIKEIVGTFLYQLQ